MGERIKKYLNTSNINEEYEKLPAMTGADIARELGITRQAVSQTLKRALVKMHKEFMKAEKVGAFEAAVQMAIGLDIGESDADMKAFFKLFPPKTRKEIEQNAVEHLQKKK